MPSGGVLRRLSAFLLLLAAATRLWGWRPAPPLLRGGPLPLEEGAWAALARLRTTGLGASLGMPPPLDAWLLGLATFAAGLLALWLVADLSCRWWGPQEEDPAPAALLRPWVWPPVMMLLMPLTRLGGAPGASPTPVLLGAGLLLTLWAVATPPRRWPALTLGLLAAAAGLALAHPGLLISPATPMESLATPLLPGKGKTWFHLTLPMGVAGAFFVLSPVMLWVAAPRAAPAARMGGALLALAAAVLAAWQGRFLGAVAPFVALGFGGWLFHLGQQWQALPGSAARVLPHLLAVASLLPCLLAHRADPLPPESVAVAQVLAQARHAGLKGRVLTQPEHALLVQALSALTPVPGPGGEPSPLAAFRHRSCQGLSGEMARRDLDFVLLSSHWLDRAARDLALAGAFAGLPKDFPIKLDRKNDKVRFRHLGGVTVYHLCPWHMLTALGGDITLPDVRVSAQADMAVAATSQLAEEVNFGRDRRAAPGAVLFGPTPPALRPTLKVLGPPGMAVLARLPIVTPTTPGQPGVASVFASRGVLNHQGETTLPLAYGPKTPWRGAWRATGPVRVIWQDLTYLDVPLTQPPAVADHRLAKPLPKTR